MSSGKVITAVLAAAGGAALGVLLAPDKGSETRRKIAYKYDKYADKAGEKFKNVKENISDKMENMKAKAKNKQEEVVETVADEFSTTGSAV